MLAQGVGDFMAHDLRGLVVAELQLIEDAGVEGDLAAGHAKGIDLLAAQQVDFPGPLARAWIPWRRKWNQIACNAPQSQQLRMVWRCQRALTGRLPEHLLVLLGGGGFDLLGGHQLGEGRRPSHIDLRGSRQRTARRCGEQKAAAAVPAAGRIGTIGRRGLEVTKPAHGANDREFLGQFASTAMLTDP